MILAVLTLGGAILGVTAIAGLLMLYQIRQSTDFQGSAKSVFAGDAGIEWALYNYFQPPPGAPAQPPSPLPVFSNGASLDVTCYDNNSPANVVACDDTANASSAIAKGTAGGTKRAFFVDLTDATSAFQ